MSLQRSYIQLTAADVRHLRLARECYSKYPVFLYYPPGREYSKSYLRHPNQTHELWLNEYVVSRVRDWPTLSPGCTESDAGPAVLSALLGLVAAGAAYGGIHLLAWNPPVATWAEVLLWRISGITVATFGVMPPVVFFFWWWPHRCCRMRSMAQLGPGGGNALGLFLVCSKD